jgi:hypothetical protein
MYFIEAQGAISKGLSFPGADANPRPKTDRLFYYFGLRIQLI